MQDKLQKQIAFSFSLSKKLSEMKVGKIFYAQ